MSGYALPVLAILLGCAGVCDVMWRRVPNALVLVLLALGTAIASLSSGLAGATNSLLMVTLGLVMWLPFYAFRMMGAGDVKLFAAASAWLTSASSVLFAAAATAIAGGILAIIWAMAQRRAIAMVGSLLTSIRFRVPVVYDTRATKLPYGIAMGIGILWAFTRA